MNSLIENLPVLENVILWSIFLFITLIIGNLAWRYPSKLKEMYANQVKRWPKWMPFRRLNLSYGQSNFYIWGMRFFTAVWALMLLYLALSTFLRWLGLTK